MPGAGDVETKPAQPYPGSEATVGQLLGLADEYFKAAYGLLPQVSRIDPRTSSAPARLCAIHAVECYLNAFLMFHGMSREEVGGLTELNRVFATLKEIGVKVAAAIRCQPYEPTDPRFKRYW